jgi:isochorismate synthase EntC
MEGLFERIENFGDSTESDVVMNLVSESLVCMALIGEKYENEVEDINNINTEKLLNDIQNDNEQKIMMDRLMSNLVMLTKLLKYNNIEECKEELLKSLNE